MSSVAFAEKLRPTGPVGEVKARLYPDIPAMLLVELNADRDREVLVRMQDLAHRKRMRGPGITDAEMADYLALAENYRNFEHWLDCRHGSAEQSGYARSATAWALGTLAIVAVLTTGLIVAIAVSVSGL